VKGKGLGLRAIGLPGLGLRQFQSATGGQRNLPKPLGKKMLFHFSGKN
jgi:hypothetical protein